MSSLTGTLNPARHSHPTGLHVLEAVTVFDAGVPRSPRAGRPGRCDRLFALRGSPSVININARQYRLLILKNSADSYVTIPRLGGAPSTLSTSRSEAVTDQTLS